MPGRGGAGNYEYAAWYSSQSTLKPSTSPPTTTAKPSTSSSTTASDLEAQQPRPTPSLPLIDPANPPRRPTEYAHTGRGGAGNWYQPLEVAKTGTYNTDVGTTGTSFGTSVTDPSPLTSMITLTNGSKGTQGDKPHEYPSVGAWLGRGGAGNYAPTVVAESAAQAEVDQKKAGEDALAEAVARGKAERDVELGLARPERAFDPTPYKERVGDAAFGSTVGMESVGVVL